MDNRVEETLQLSVNIEHRIAALIDKVFVSSLSPEEKMDYIHECTLIREGIKEMNSNLIKMNIPEEKQMEYLGANNKMKENLLTNRDYLLSALSKQKANNEETNRNEDDLPPIL